MSCVSFRSINSICCSTVSFEQAREELRVQVGKAHEAGESVSGLARRLGVTRTRVYQILGKR